MQAAGPRDVGTWPASRRLHHHSLVRRFRELSPEYPTGAPLKLAENGWEGGDLTRKHGELIMNQAMNCWWFEHVSSYFLYFQPPNEGNNHWS